MSRPLLILFGTQNGNAKSIATDVYDELQPMSPEAGCSLTSMGDYAKKNPTLPLKEVLIVVLSTTGNGEPPDDARPFIRALRKRIGASEKQPDLLYSILGLGDSEYTNFNAAAKLLHQLLGKLGATPFHPPCWADEARGLPSFVEPWKMGIRSAIRGLVRAAPNFPRLVPAQDASFVTLHLLNDNVSPSSGAAALCSASAIPPSNSASFNPNVLNSSTCASDSKTNACDCSEDSVADLKQNSDSNCNPKLTSSDPLFNIDPNSTTLVTAAETAADVCTSLPFSSSSGLSLSLANNDHSCDSKHKHSMTPPARDDTKRPKTSIAELKKKLGISSKNKNQIEVNFLDGLPSMEEPFLARWKAIETERELQGYTPEAPFMAAVIGARFLTTSSSVDRAVLHLELKLPGQDGAITYSPGDAVGIHAPNPLPLADAVIQRLKLDGSQLFSLSRGTETSSTDSKGMSLVLPHIYSPCTVSDAFRYCCDLTKPPSKAILLMLGNYCSNPAEAQTVKQLTADLAYDVLCTSKPNFLELLEMFPSCHPPLAEVLTVLPPLMPRYYSITSSPCSYPDKLHLALTIVQYNTTAYGSWPPRVRQGVCSNWLNQVAKRAEVFPESRLATQVSKAVFRSNRFDSPVITPQARRFEVLSDLPGVLKGPGGLLHVPAFIRRSTGFILPEDVSRSIIMVGPGTGVAPFRGFVQHRHTELTALKSGGTCLGHWRGLDFGLADDEEEDELELGIPKRFNEGDGLQRKDSLVTSLAQTHLTEPGHTLGKIILFFGCRHPEQDFLYKDDWAFFLSSGTLSEFHVAFSRLNEQKEYVQDKLRQQGLTIVDQVLNRNSYFFVCGDGTRMAKDVMRTLIELLQQHGAMSREKAEAYVEEMVRSNRYVQDIWS